MVIELPPDNANHALTREVGGELTYEFVPGSELYQLRINRHGFRDLERELARSPGTRRILALGDSITMGGSQEDYVPLLQTWPLVLEQILDDPAGQRVEVWNAGIVGYNLQQYAALLEERVDAIAPDTIMVGLCLNDLSARQVLHRSDAGFVVEWYDRSYPVALDLGPARNRWLLDHSWLWRLLNLAVAGLTAAEEPRLDVDLELCQDALRRILTVGQQRDIPVLALLFPHLGDDGVSSAESNDQHRRMDAATRMTGVPVIALAEEFRQHPTAALRAHPDDPVHPGALGHCLAAQGAYRDLLAAGLDWVPRDRQWALAPSACAPGLRPPPGR